jgi:CPA2 family monovalent cation:H+ antiporter-2
MLLAVAETDLAATFIELGAVLIGLAVLARLAARWGIPSIALYLLGGLAFGNGGLAPLKFSEAFVHLGAELGVVLLLFMLGLEYTARQLWEKLRSGLPAGTLDLVVNFAPGVVCGLLLGFGPIGAALLGGATYVSSSGIIAKALADLRRMDNPETPLVVSILVIEDLAMAVYLPLVAVLLVDQGLSQAVLSVLGALATVALVLLVAIRLGPKVSRSLARRSDEVILLSTLGLVLLVAGIAQKLQVSAAVGAFLVGLALSDPVDRQARRLVEPLRDLSAAVFFFFFGLQIDPSSLLAELPIAGLLAVVSAVTKIGTGAWAARRAGLDRAAGLRAGVALVPRGEFSIVIAGLGVDAGLDARMGPFAAAYVFVMALAGPILMRAVDWINSPGQPLENTSDTQ